MIILPAIDILDGKCVRLKKGEYNTAEKVAEDPFKTIDSFARSGAEFVHLVDLGGAKSGKPENFELIKDIIKYSSEKHGIKCEIGGGIRTMETICRYLDNGAERIILGSAALKDPKLTEKAVSLYGDRISVGIDALDGFVMTSGWTEGSKSGYIEIAKRMEDVGVGNIIFTDISCDGMLSGPNLDMLSMLSKAVSIRITASGGIKDIDDIKALCDLGVYGAICGKSIYAGTLSLSEAVKLASEKQGQK